jgi:hypothetical protein
MPRQFGVKSRKRSSTPVHVLTIAITTRKGEKMACDGVFPHLVGTSAFIDRVDISILGHRRLRPKHPIQVIQNLPIGGPGRLYSRSLHAVCVFGKNPVESRYGRRRRYLPPLRMTLRSEHTPLTSAQVATAQDCLARRGYRSYLTSLEVTADIYSRGPQEILNHLLPGRRSLREWTDERGRRSLYLGRPSSSWQLRIYEKTGAIVRIEFVLRRNFLRASGVRQLADVLAVGRLGLGRMIFPPCAIREVLRRMHEDLIW